MAKIISALTIVIGIALAITPWVFRFTADRPALLDVAIGGIVVAVLGALTYGALTTASAPPSR
jgi:hypothetical protein